MAAKNIENMKFQRSFHRSSQDILLQQVAIFVEKNTKFILSSSSRLGNFKCEAATTLIFAFCERLCQPLEVKYMTCELFDRFMTKHIADLRQYVVETTKPSKRKSDYMEILKKVETQAILRMLSCIQVASKISSISSVVRIRDVGNMLRLAGNCYSPQIILNSEIRILKTLDYKVNVDTAFTFIELALAILEYKISTFNVSKLQDPCIKILDVIHLKKRRIYSQLFFRVTGKYQMTKQDRSDFVAVENDLVLLGSAVVDCAAFLEYQLHFKEVTEQLSAIAMIRCEDIMDFASVIMEEIF